MKVPEGGSASLQVVDRLVSDLERDVGTISRDDAIRSLRDLFIAKRLNAAALVEDLRLKALGLLMKSLEESGEKPVNPAMMVALIRMLSEVGAVDMGIATGTTKAGVNLVNFVNNSNTNSAVCSSAGAIAGSDGNSRVTNSTIKDIGFLLEAINCITDGVKHDPKLLDGEVREASSLSDADPSAS